MTSKSIVQTSLPRQSEATNTATPSDLECAVPTFEKTGDSVAAMSNRPSFKAINRDAGPAVYDGPELLRWPDPRLQMVCDPFDFKKATYSPDACDHKWFPELWDLLDHMWHKTEELMGFGLAAPQLGSPIRALVIHIPGGCKVELINPEITKVWGGKFISDEGCLSWPGKRTRVMRYKMIKVHGCDRWGNPVSFGGKNTQAAALQHEIDHLNGINLADYAEGRQP